jgi:protein SCO1/2
MTTDIQPAPWLGDHRPPAHLVILLLAVPIIAVMAFVIFQPIKVLPRISLAPAFTLTDQDGQRLTSEELRGRLVLYNFTYTGCAPPCPQTSDDMRQLQQQLTEVETGGLPLELVTISFDPARDTPDRLRAYADGLGADTRTWRFVTGEPAQLKNIIGGGFGIYYNGDENGNYTFDPVFVLVDGWGMVRAVYRTPNLDLGIVARDLRLIVQEVRNSQGVNRYAYEAAHLFLCYPK